GRALALQSCIAFLIATSSSCHRQPNANDLFQHAYQEFVHGNFVQSQAASEEGYRQFERSEPEHALKFRILEAETIEWRGMSPQALEMLNSVSTSREPESIVAIFTQKGLAYARLHQFGEAESALEEAQRLCTGGDLPQSCGALLRGQGILAMQEGKF